VVKNPAFGTAGEPALIDRDYGFGATEGTVTIGVRKSPPGDVTWSNLNHCCSKVAQQRPTRGDQRRQRQVLRVGIYVTVGGSLPIYVQEGQSIQAAIDDAEPGSLIIVGPGVYDELVILYNNIRLQGTGAGVTNIRAFKIPAEKLQIWREKVESLRAAGSFDLLPGQTPGLDTFKNEFGPGIIVLGTDDMAMNGARIDGFRISGADQGGAILVNGYTQNLLISNNRISGNQGFYGGGIRVGHPELISQAVGEEQQYVDAQNDSLTIQHNHIAQNGGLNGAGGGISIHTGAEGYTITRNWIVGNFTSGDGAGIGHLGRSNNGTISENTILFNQSFNQGLTVIGGGMLIAGLPAMGTPIGPGSGAVVVDGNRIQGNMAGAGDGGGIALRSTNTDPITSPTT
jgi:large repetitive protein